MSDARYHLQMRGPVMAMVLGVPDPEKPADPSRDARDGPAILEGNPHTPAFWSELERAGFRWVESGFKRFWRRRRA